MQLIRTLASYTGGPRFNPRITEREEKGRLAAVGGECCVCWDHTGQHLVQVRSPLREGIPEIHSQDAGEDHTQQRGHMSLRAGVRNRLHSRTCPSVVLCCCDKDHDQRQLGEKRAYYDFETRVH